MCGVAGFFTTKKQDKLNMTCLQDMAEKLHHRGPDGRGFYENNDNTLGLAHTRLAIIDLHTGEQPIYDKENKLIIVANGEFYNYKKMRGELVAEGERFTTKSDCEVALKLYKKHGLDFVNYLRGEFAFSIYDETKDRLIVVRDRFGIRPLFFYNNEESFVFSSEVKSLLQCPIVPKEISKKAALHQMMQVMVPGKSLWKNIHSLRPGHMMIVERNEGRIKITDKKYWDVNFPESGQHAQWDAETAIKKVREKLIESVALRLEADVPVACYLSGGIDSCSIIGMASAIQQSPVKGFTISFDDKRYDESTIAKEMADSCGAEQDILNVSSTQLYGENFKKALWYSERTFYNTLGVAKMLMSDHVTRNGYKVVITGEGSDELFGGYAAFKRDMFLHSGLADGKSMEDKLRASNKIFSGSILADEKIEHEAFNDVIGFTPSWIQPWMHTLNTVKQILSDDFLEELGDYDPIAAIVETFDVEQVKNRHALDKTQYTWIKTMLEGQILNWGGDRVDMANSLESRPAFLDHHVAELAVQLKPEYRIHDGVEKWVVREAMKEILPEVLYNREKFAFMAPPSHTNVEKQKAVNELIAESMSSDRLKKYNVVDDKKWKTFIEQHSKLDDHSQQSRNDIVINHALQLHMIPEMFASEV